MLCVCHTHTVPAPGGVGGSHVALQCSRVGEMVSVKWCRCERQLSRGDVRGLLQG